jgi:glucose-1-phosphate cytidylyltransferase
VCDGKLSGMEDPGALDTLILCGGRGTRAYPDTRDVPKPLLTVGGRPIVEHVMEVYRRHGCLRFVLATGYLSELFEQRYSGGATAGEIAVVDTGTDTDTGRRVVLAAEHCRGPRFFATYGDGVGNVALTDLLRAHLESGAWLTVTTVPLPSQYGTLVIDDAGRVVDFREKPRLEDHWINAGFFVVERRALEVWAGDNLERDVLPDLAERGVLYAYRHRGFWRSMDTYKDRQELDVLASGPSLPWLTDPGP